MENLAIADGADLNRVSGNMRIHLQLSGVLSGFCQP